MRLTRDTILGIVADLQSEDFAFTVTAHGTPWDVYRFNHKGRRGTVALRIVSQKLEIGTFRQGELTELEVVRELSKSAPS